MKDFKGKFAVITGGGSGIGLGLAGVFAGQGMHVMVADIDASAAEQAAAKLAEEYGTRCIGIQCDVSEFPSVEHLADCAYGEFGRVDILCNNAGVLVTGPIRELQPKDAQWVLAVNTLGVIYGCRIFLPRMIEQGGPAHILNTASEAALGLHPTVDMNIYTASKHAVLGFSEGLRREADEFGIGVSVLCPSGVQSQLTNATRNRHEKYGGPAESPPLATPDGTTLMLDPLEAGRLALEGIKANDFVIVTHASTEAFTITRANEVSQAFRRLEQRLRKRDG